VGVLYDLEYRQAWRERGKEGGRSESEREREIERSDLDEKKKRGRGNYIKSFHEHHT
jgi:hypothetical protein